MLAISLQSLRAHRGTLAGAFVAIFLAVTLGYGTGLLMDAALSAPGPGRFADVDYVLRADPTVPTAEGESEDAIPGPLLDAALADTIPGAYPYVSFPAAAALGGDLKGHGWSGAVLRAGRAPRGRHEVAVAGRARLGSRLRVTTPTGEATFRVTGLTHGKAAVYFADATARRLSGHPRQANAIVVQGPRPRVGPGIEVLDHDHAALADAQDVDRVALVAIFGTMGGIAGLVALFVVCGTFTLALVQRRREIAVLRALGAAPHQVRRLIAVEALIVSLVAGGLGVAAGRPLAQAIVDILGDHGIVPDDFAPGGSWIPLVAALGGAVVIAQAAVFAAARRAGRVRPAEALREAAIERTRPSLLQLAAGVLALGGGVAMALIFTGFWAQAFAILTGVLLAAGVGLLGRGLLGAPAALLARPLRAFGASGLLVSTSLSANRWRTAALATPIVLVAMLAGTEGTIESSSRRHAEAVTAERTTADYVVLGRDGGPIPPGIKGTAVAETRIFPDAPKLSSDGSWPAAGMRGLDGLDLAVVAGDPRRGVAVSRVFAETGDLRVGDTFGVRLGDLTHQTLRVAAIYERAAGLGDVLLPDAHAPTSAVFVRGQRPRTELDGVRVLTRDEYLAGLHAGGLDQAWGVWMIIALAALFSALALINTAAMATAERRAEFATIRLLGGTRGQAVRTIALELVPTVLVALLAGAAVVAASVHGVPSGLTGIPLDVPETVVAGIVAGAAALGLLAALVCTRLALRVAPALATRERA